MTTSASNTAVRERRRRSSPQVVEQMDVIRAITAAEYSRRQFVLNYAASRDTRLLIPGQKAETIKQAEEWVLGWMHDSGHGSGSITSEFFKYTVDERLWNALVGTSVPFPFAFMREVSEKLLAGSPYEDATKQQNVKPGIDRARRKSEANLPDPISTIVEVRLVEDAQQEGDQTRLKQATAGGKDGLSRTDTNTSTSGTTTNSPSLSPSSSNQQPAAQQQRQQRQQSPPDQQRRNSLLPRGLNGSIKKGLKSTTTTAPAAAQNTTARGRAPNTTATSGVVAAPAPVGVQKRRSMSLTSLDETDLKLGRKTGNGTQDRFSFLGRWSRFKGRRTPA